MKLSFSSPLKLPGGAGGGNVARLRSEELQCSGPATPEWEFAVEKLAVSLNRSCVAVVRLSGSDALAVEDCLAAPLQQQQQQQQQPGSASSAPCRSQPPTEVLQLPGLLSAKFRPGGKDQGAAMSAVSTAVQL